jgi:HEAT repeat protein
MSDIARTSDALTELARGLEAGIEAFALYPADAVEYRQAYARLGRAFAAVWEIRPSFTLDVRRDGLLCDGAPVPLDDGREGRLAQTLWDGGIRSLTFEAGADGRETVRFLAAVQKARSLLADDVDDLRTFLWNLDLEYIQYSVDEAYAVEAEAAPEEEPAAREPSSNVRAQVVQETKEAGPRAGIVDIDAFDSTLYFLDKTEIEYLKSGIEREYEQDLGANVAALLLDVFELQTDAPVRGEVIGVMERLLPHLLGQGNFAAAAYLLSEIRGITAKAAEVSGEHRRTLGQLAETLSEPAVFRQLFHYLEDAPEPPSQGDLTALLLELRPEALSSVLRWVDGLKNPRARAALIDAVERMAKARPRSLSLALESEDRTVVLRTLSLIQRFKQTEQTEAVCALGSHADPGIRVAVTETLVALGGAPAVRQLTKMLGDRQAEVRVAALKALEMRASRSAVIRMEELIDDKSILEKDLAEQRTLFETYGTVAGPQGVALLEPLMLGKKGVGRKSPDLRACAAVALGKIGTPAARLALQKAERDKNPVVRNAAARALRTG